ncbi:glycosyltransferase [Aliifodinibius sp. S!AR15-10]|uniref:glycosyltransferase family 4 protein n=1 Tax=Aliifodinibius sp. S!AR15-10 TaxID=2950437 RepID=UPI00285ECB18|nr:glycosyltransferase [Aliifodinibius sp. S!AR15-10]MDR8390258.1 glycosyltransferase [Aliifodinibius sp. S!AR15-10]
MNIIINVSSIYKGGAEQVAHSFINECKEIPGHEYHIFLCENILSLLDVETFSDNFYFHKLAKRPGSSIYNLYKSLRYYDDLEKKIKPDFVISTGGHGYWKPSAPIVTAFNIPHYLYPESPYFQKIPFEKKIYWELKKRFDLSFYKKSDAIVVQTDDVKERVKKLLPKARVFTVSNTVNGAFLDPKCKARKLLEREENEVRLLTVSANYPHKNLEIIKSVLDELFYDDVYNIRFVLTLPEKVFEANFAEQKYQENIINVGPVHIDECPSLYGECDVMFLPTLLECFSASYVEAMAMKKPILTSDLGFAHTICKEAARYFDPVDGRDIANKIMELVNTPSLQDKLIQRGTSIYNSINTPRERALSFLKIGEDLLKNV